MIPPRSTRRGPISALGLTLAALVAAPVPGAGHELGTVRVAASFHGDGSYRVELVVDTEHLPPVARPGRRPERPPVGIARLDGLGTAERARFETFLTAYLDASAVSFDGRPVAPRVEIAAVEAPAVTVILSGPIPPGARTFGWVSGLPLGQYLLTLGHEGDGARVRQWLEAPAASEPFPLARGVAPPTRFEVAMLYLTLGFTHIVPNGLDHILFVLGIFLLSRRPRPVLAQVTAFTVAHTLTLALSIYGLVRLSPAMVEPLIALSIVYVAVENVLTDELRPSRVAVVFAFGLLHGLGFAGVLTRLGLPRSEFLTALLSFNVGVEAGQLAVIAAAFLAVGALWGGRPWYRQRIVVPASVAIGAVGLWWVVERTLS